MCEFYGLSLNVNKKHAGLALQLELSFNMCGTKFKFMYQI